MAQCPLVYRILCALAILALCAALPSAAVPMPGKSTALQRSEQQPVQDDIVDEDTTVITSDGGLDLDYSKHMAVFKKNVVVRDHRGSLKAQEMRVLFAPEGSRIKTIEAAGDVQIMQQGRTAQSQNALIKSEEGIIELTGDPKILQGKDIYSADKITIFSKTNQVIFEPKAKLILFQQPGEKKELF